VRRALRGAVASVLRRQRPDGGFVYRRGEPFVHMGLAHTASPADTSNLFPTWFGVHAIGLACQLLPEHPLAALDWRFNSSCSMGWHDASVAVAARPDPLGDRLPEAAQAARCWLRHQGRRTRWRARRAVQRGRC
jgi:hypothetical protein